VIGVIVPWNYPFHNVLSAVAAALMAGNGALVKVSEYASFGAERIEQVLREILARRGHDPELVQVVTGYGETGAALVSSGVDKVLFIGSPAVGKLVMRAASATLTPVILELGGKDAFIVFDDADFEHCIDIAIRGAFINCGQSQCLIVHRIELAAVAAVPTTTNTLWHANDAHFVAFLLSAASCSVFAVLQTAFRPSVSTCNPVCTTSSSLR
jgi:acyl-CoA reductase-like NAD-dependent aldehyde dehydrogenase